MKNALIVYATTEGQTKKIAEFLAKELTLFGVSTQVLSAEAAPPKLSPNAVDAVIVGASVHAGSFQVPLREWVKANSEVLSRLPSAFFSVCLGILEKENAKTQEDERRIVSTFLAWSRWQPKLTAIFAGALMYSRYGWLKRILMKRIAAKAGGDTDAHRDYEYTDWNEVRAFATNFLARLSRPEPEPAPGREEPSLPGL
ncbi:MAG: menaquinone-dependent protoporphyrinogen IX dehydrogenase [Bdellovibrionaceae bacterium]|nr:menaquinone-dependent protoporphyrinogen IX dehydrogenase [Pseudobdellovibrionaceae bacterium]